MSFILTRMALRVSGLHPTEKLVLATIADHANAKHAAWPSIATISTIVGRNRATIFRLLNSLEKKRLVERESGRGRHRTNTYKINPDILAEHAILRYASEIARNGVTKHDDPASIVTSDLETRLRDALAELEAARDQLQRIGRKAFWASKDRP